MCLPCLAQLYCQRLVLRMNVKGHHVLQQPESQPVGQPCQVDYAVARPCHASQLLWTLPKCQRMNGGLCIAATTAVIVKKSHARSAADVGTAAGAHHGAAHVIATVVSATIAAHPGDKHPPGPCQHRPLHRWSRCQLHQDMHPRPAALPKSQHLQLHFGATPRMPTTMSGLRNQSTQSHQEFDLDI